MTVGTSAVMAAAKGTSLILRQAIGCAIEERQVKVWIYERVPVAGEMLCAGENAFRSQAANHRSSHLGDLSWVRAKAAARGDRTGGIGRQIQHRRKVEIDTRGAKFASHGA